MTLHRITSLKDLARFTPSLLKLHGELEGKWEPDLTSHEFLLELINHFSPESFFFGDFDENGELIYFVAILKQDSKKCMFWLFYMNKSFRDRTRDILNTLKDYFRKLGFTTVYSQSTRTSSSYERWLEKFGAEKVAIVYKFKL